MIDDRMEEEEEDDKVCLSRLVILFEHLLSLLNAGSRGDESTSSRDGGRSSQCVQLTLL